MNIAMKAAPLSEQLQDRYSMFRDLEQKPIIELYLDGIDIYDKSSKEEAIRTCCALPCCYIAHVPNIDIEGRLFDFANDDWKIWIDWTAEFVKSVNSDILVIHYFCGHEKRWDKEEARSICHERIEKIAKLYPDLNFLIENYGLVFWPDRSGNLYYPVSPLDLFLPWDMIDFQRDMANRGVDNVRLVLDTAHAAISCNMFNALRRDRSLRSDKRFRYLDHNDMSHANYLNIMDYVENINYDAVHISDAFILARKPFSRLWLKEAITTEGLALGDGHLPNRDIARRLLFNNENVMFVTEMSEKDNSQSMNQREAVNFLLALE